MALGRVLKKKEEVVEKHLFFIIIILSGSFKSLPATAQLAAKSSLPKLYTEAARVADSLLACHLPAQESMNEKAWLKEVFGFAQENVFEEYRLYTTTNELLNDGTFNCVSGTAFFALLLRQVGYEVTPFEMQHHVYLSVLSGSGKRYIIEATDKHKGVFRQGKYTAYYLYNRQFGSWQQPVTLHELAGLEWYNLAIAAYNQQSFEEAIYYCQEAQSYYPDSERIKLLEGYVRYCAELYNTNTVAVGGKQQERVGERLTLKRL